MTSYSAYNNSEAVKDKYIMKADEFRGKEAYPKELSMPFWVAYLNHDLHAHTTDSVSETLQLRFFKAVKPGADLDQLYHPFRSYCLGLAVENLEKLPESYEITRVISAITNVRNLHNILCDDPETLAAAATETREAADAALAGVSSYALWLATRAALVAEAADTVKPAARTAEALIMSSATARDAARTGRDNVWSIVRAAVRTAKAVAITAGVADAAIDLTYDKIAHEFIRLCECVTPSVA